MKSSKVQIFAGPCSVDEKNIEEILEISEIKINGKNAISGTRVVGSKSRTEFNPTGEGMGMDSESLLENMRILQKGGSWYDFSPMPSIEYAKKVAEGTNLIVATEINHTSVYLPLYAQVKKLKNRFLPWCPAVNQLGWYLRETSIYAKENGWIVGIKNGKWTGKTVDEIRQDPEKETPIGKTWAGLFTYAASETENVVLIHRGFDVPEKGSYRNLPIHEIAIWTKKKTGGKVFFDPSHTFGPNLRDKIIEGVIEAAKMKVDDENYLYDGFLIETGTSKTDTEQHISIKELKNLVERLAEIRDLDLNIPVTIGTRKTIPSFEIPKVKI